MKISVRGRALIALLATIGLFAVAASPVSAMPDHDYHLTTGALTIDLDGSSGGLAPQTFTFTGGDTSHECDVPAETSSAQITTDLENDTFNVTGGTFNPGYFNFTFNPTRNYRLQVTNVSTVDSEGFPAHGQFEPHPSDANTLLITAFVILEATITSDANTDCTFDNQFTCSMGVFASITGENDVYHLEDDGPTITGDTYTFDVTTANALFFETGACDPPYASLAISGTGSIETLTLQGPTLV